jgi:hypothetical protein
MTTIPTETEIQHLIERAKSHDLGIEFLLNGSLDAVAATFNVHAFVIDAARDRLSSDLTSEVNSKTVSRTSLTKGQ